MIESASHRCIELLEADRDVLYSTAQSCAAPDYAESLLQQAVRQVFKEFVEQKVSERDFPQQVIAVLQRNRTVSPESTRLQTVNAGVMPAGAWARLTAAVQIEAARLGGAAEQSMLAYDPLLAPKKKKSSDDDLVEGFNLSPWTRFVVAAAIVLFIGIVASIILTTHAESKPAANPSAASMPRGTTGAVPADRMVHP